MRRKRVFACLSILIICALIFAGCKSRSGDTDSTNPVSSDADSTDTANTDTVLDRNNLPNAPTQYGYALHVKAGAEFLLYLNDRGGVISYVPLNDAAKKIEDHTNIDDTDCYNSVMDIFAVAIDDLDLDTKETDFKLTIVDSNMSHIESNEILNRATDAAEAVIRDRGLEGVVARQSFEDLDENMMVDHDDLQNAKDDYLNERFDDMGYHDDPDHPGNNGPDDNDGHPGDGGPGIDEHPEDPIQELKESNPNYDKETDTFVCDSLDEIDSVIALIRENHIDGDTANIHVSSDLTLNLDSASAYKDVCLDMDGNSISVSGTFTLDMVDFNPLLISNASEVDLSGLKIDYDSFRDLGPAGPREGEDEEQAYWNTQRSLVDVVKIVETSDKAVNIPYPYHQDGPERDEKHFSIFEPYCEYEIKGDGIYLTVSGPLDDYETRKEKETKVLKNVFASGEYHSLTKQTSNNFYYVCTDITMDIGDCMLPDMDYEAICVGKGGHLTLTGKLYVTGGCFNIETFEYDGVDLTGLTVVKKHPSPDVINVRFDPSVGINDALCHCKAASGTIKFSKSSNKVAITIW